MSTPKLPFRIEVDHGTPPNPNAPAGWRTVAQDNSKLYLEGLATGWAERTPRAALRLVRDRDGRVIREWPASNEPGIGAVVGWPSVGQLLSAARRCLEEIATTKDATYEQRTAATAALEMIR